MQDTQRSIKKLMLLPIAVLVGLVVVIAVVASVNGTSILGLATGASQGQTTPLSLGVSPENGSIGSDKEQDYWTFTPKIGQELLVVVKADSKDFQPSIDLFNSDGQVVIYNDGGPGGTSTVSFIVKGEGEHKAQVWSFTGTKGDYSVNLVEKSSVESSMGSVMSLEGTKIEKGKSEAGVVSVPGEFKHIFFSGLKDEKVYISMSADSGTFEPSLDLFAADGTNLTYDDGPVGGTASITYDLPSDGDYKLKLWSYSNTTGSYKVAFHNDASSAPVSGNKEDGSSDQVSSVQGATQSGEGSSGPGNFDKGEIKNGDLVTQVDLSKGAQHEYVFEGKKGQKLIASMTANSDSLAPSLDLFTPGKIPSVYVDGKYGKTATIDELLFLGAGKAYELPEDGKYVLMAWSYVGSAGKYDLSFQLEEGSSQSEVPKKEEESTQSQIVSGGTDPKDQSDTLPGAKMLIDGDVVTEDLIKVGVKNSSSSYTLQNYYVFHAKKGQHVTALHKNVGGGEYDPSINIIGPGSQKHDWMEGLPADKNEYRNLIDGKLYLNDDNAGAAMGANETNRDARLAAISIPDDGFYTIILGSSKPTAGLSEAKYELSFEISDQIPGDPKGELINGSPSESEIGENFEREVWTFKGKVDEFASITVAPLDGDLMPDIKVYDPDGTVLIDRLAQFECGWWYVKFDGKTSCKNGTSFPPIKIKKSGSYAIAVAGPTKVYNEDNNIGSRGKYLVNVDLSDTIVGVPKGSIEFGQAINEEISLTGQKHVYAFEGEKGESFAFTAVPVSGSKLTPKLEVFTPDYETLLSGVGVVDTTRATVSNWSHSFIELPQNGTYYVRVGDNAGETGSYTFTYHNKVRSTGYVGKGISDIDPETGCGMREYDSGDWGNIYYDGVYRSGGNGGLGSPVYYYKTYKDHEGNWAEDTSNHIHFYPSGRIMEATIEGKHYLYPDEGRIYDMQHMPGRFGADSPSKYDGKDPDRPELPLWVTDPDNPDALGVTPTDGEPLWKVIDQTAQKGPWQDWDLYKSYGFEKEGLYPTVAVGDAESGWQYVRQYRDFLPLYSSSPGTLMTSTTTDVGFWDFVRTKRNSINDGRPWGIYGNIEYGVSTLTLKTPTDRHGKDASFGAVAGVWLGPQTDQNLGNAEPLDRDNFTVALRTNPDGISKNTISRKHKSLWGAEEWNDFSPSRILLTGGPYYRWLQVEVNSFCNVEVSLNTAGGSKWPAIFSSDTVIALDEWHDIIISVNLPDKQVALTIDGKTELFDLPPDFQWDFKHDFEQGKWSQYDDPVKIDNALGMTAGGGAGYFQGDLDWMYVTNGVLDPSEIESRIEELRKSPPPRDTSVKSVTLNDSNTLVEVVVDPVTWEVWNFSGMSDPGERQIVMEEIYEIFDDQFDWVFIVNNNQNESGFKPDYLGLYHGLSGDILGIGFEVGESSETYGSKDRLKGLIHFPYRGAILGGPSLHELMHTWANAAVPTKMFDFENEGKEVSAGSHWGISSGGGQLGGFDITTLEELPMDESSDSYKEGYRHYKAYMTGLGFEAFGLWANYGNSVPFSNLELYLMGLIPPSELEDIVYFEELEPSRAASFYECDGFDSDGFGCFSAKKKITLTGEELIGKLGDRFPSYENSQKEFRALTVVITPEKMTDGEIKEVHEQVTWFSNPGDDGASHYNFYEATGNRATIKMDELNKALKSYEPSAEISVTATSTPSVQGN